MVHHRVSVSVSFESLRKKEKNIRGAAEISKLLTHSTMYTRATEVESKLYPSGLYEKTI